MTRRRMLGIGGALGLMASTGLAASAALARRPPITGAQLRSAVPLPPPFEVPLPIPAVLQPVSTSGGADRYEITQREASAEILPGIRTPLWTYDGTFPGPTIESRRGRPVTVTHRNELPVPTVVHLHGGRTPATSDGYPTDLVLPRGWQPAAHGQHGSHRMRDPRAVVTERTRDYTFPLDQRPALLWYHDHRMDFTAPAIWRGLAGLHIVRDDTPWPVHEVDAARYRATRPQRLQRQALRARGRHRRRAAARPRPDRRRPGTARRAGHPPAAADRPGRTLRPDRRLRRPPDRQPRQAPQPARLRPYP